MPDRHPNDQLALSLPERDSPSSGQQEASTTLVDLLEHWRHNDGPAVIVDHDGEPEITTYAWLNDKAIQIAAGLHAAAVEPEERIAILAPNSPAWIAAYFGILAAGATAVPLDYHVAAADLEGMLTRSRCRRLFTSKASLERLPESWSTDAEAIYVVDEFEDAAGKVS